jgi:lipopolysaccharide export system permease protein
MCSLRYKVKLLDRYLLRQFIQHFFTVTIAFVAIYLLVDFIEKFDNFSRAGKSLGLATRYFLLNIPFIVDQLGPVLILLSGVISLGILNHTHELTALKAGGIPLKMIVRPLLMGAAACTLFSLAAAQWLLPMTISMTNTIWYEQVKGKVPLGIYRNGRYYFKGHEGFYSFEWPNPKLMVFKNFSYSRWNDDYNVGSLVAATWAKWNSKAGEWILDEVQVQKRGENGSYTITNMPYWQVGLPEKPEDFLIPQNETAELSLTGLYREIAKKETASQTEKAWADFLGRLSYIFLGIPLLFLGLPILLISYQKWGRDLSIAIPASCGLAFVAWGIWGAMQSLAGAGYLPPTFAAITIHILFATAGILLLRKQDS